MTNSYHHHSVWNWVNAREQMLEMKFRQLETENSMLQHSISHLTLSSQQSHDAFSFSCSSVSYRDQYHEVKSHDPNFERWGYNLTCSQWAELHNTKVSAARDFLSPAYISWFWLLCWKSLLQWYHIKYFLWPLHKNEHKTIKFSFSLLLCLVSLHMQ